MAPLALPGAQAVNASNRTKIDGSENLQGAVAPRRFTQGAKRHREYGPTDIKTLSAVNQSLSLRVPITGYLKKITLTVTGTTSANAAAVAYNAQAPYNVIRNINFRDAGGNSIWNVSGYEAYLINLLGGYRPFRVDSSSRNSTVPGAVATGGSFYFTIDIPTTFMRDGLGALANMDSRQQYSVDITLGVLTDVYSTSPTNAPTITTQLYVESWLQPPATDQLGNPLMQEPPGLGSVQYWSAWSYSWSAAGEQTILSNRVGNIIRGWIMLFYNATPALSNTMLPTTIRTELNDTTLRDDIVIPYLIDQYANYGFDPMTGVVPFMWTQDPDGLMTQETGDDYLITLGTTKLQWRFTAPAAGSVTILTNDIYPSGDVRGLVP